WVASESGSFTGTGQHSPSTNPVHTASPSSSLGLHACASLSASSIALRALGQSTPDEPPVPPVAAPPVAAPPSATEPPPLEGSPPLAPPLALPPAGDLPPSAPPVPASPPGEAP